MSLPYALEVLTATLADRCATPFRRCGAAGVFFVVACGPSPDSEPGDTRAATAAAVAAAVAAETEVGTSEQRAALFDTLLARTLRREAFSPVKEASLGIDVRADLQEFRDDFVEAGTEEALYYAISRFSNARWDRHLSLALVPGGLAVGDTAGLEVAGEDDPRPAAEAPIRFLPDYAGPPDRGGPPVRPSFFVSDRSTNDAHFGGGPIPAIGDRLVAVGDRSVAEYARAVRPYHRASLVPILRWKIAEAISQRTALVPPYLRSEELRVTLANRDGERYEVELPFLPPGAVEWQGVSEPRYPGFERVFETGTYDLHRSVEGRPVLVLRWHGFRETLEPDVDRLVAWAESEGVLGHALIIDGTRSRGGSRGAYAVQRLSPRPFKTTFGNLRISDVTVPFIEEKRQEFAASRVVDSGVRETDDDGTWLMEWLETDVMDSIRAGAAYTNDVPFKLAHAPKDSDGVLQPAPLHFRGPMVVLLGPRRGSHLDQFAAIVRDNELGRVIGMPAGAYSNTWEWDEVVTLPGTDRPLVRFMWSIGHSIRPNGEILEGNAAGVHEWVPLTAGNADRYYEVLIERALAWLEERPAA